EAPLGELEPAGVSCCHVGAALNGRRIAVDREHTAISGVQNGSGVSARAERGGNVCPAVPGLQVLQDRGEQHGSMAAAVHGLSARGTQTPLSSATCHHSRAPVPPPYPSSVSRRLPAPKSFRCSCTLS